MCYCLSQEHWSTFITEEDFKFISTNGLNTVRIPVGWWIASDPTPPKPYVGGSLQALDNAFLWAQYVFAPFLHNVSLRYSNTSNHRILRFIGYMV